jgi:cytochrome b
VVRVLHGVLLTAFVANYFLLEEGDDPHQIFGYLAAAAVLLRVLWGFRDTGAARWSAFWPSPGRLARHVRALVQWQHRPIPGHSPIGALVMILMLLGMTGLAVTGFLMEEVDYFWGNQSVEDIHEWLADGLAALVALHVFAAVVESVLLRENLPWSMVTGRRKVHPAVPQSWDE